MRFWPQERALCSRPAPKIITKLSGRGFPTFHPGQLHSYIELKSSRPSDREKTTAEVHTAIGEKEQIGALSQL